MWKSILLHFFPNTLFGSVKLTDVFVLGAGFSKAIHSKMPTMAELAKEVRDCLDCSGRALPQELDIYKNDIEMWMSYLSQEQPWLSNTEVDFNRSLASRIRELISQILDERISCIVSSNSPAWLKQLIVLWHERQANIITLNYDTLIESVARCGVPASPIAGENFQDNKQVLPLANLYPPYFSDIASRPGYAILGEGDINTFKLFKLHGSVNWYYSGRAQFFGEPIFFSDVPEYSVPIDESARVAMAERLRRLSGDKTTLIIPPVAEKNTYFNNETIKGIWRDAGRALQKASAVYIVGHSLPKSDLGMKMFLKGNLPDADTPISLVNKDQEVICKFKEALGREVQSDFVFEDEPVVKFVEKYQNLK